MESCLTFILLVQDPWEVFLFQEPLKPFLGTLTLFPWKNFYRTFFIFRNFKQRFTFRNQVKILATLNLRSPRRTGANFLLLDAICLVSAADKKLQRWTQKDELFQSPAGGSLRIIKNWIEVRKMTV